MDRASGMNRRPQRLKRPGPFRLSRRGVSGDTRVRQSLFRFFFFFAGTARLITQTRHGSGRFTRLRRCGWRCMFYGRIFKSHRSLGHLTSETSSILFGIGMSLRCVGAIADPQPLIHDPLANRYRHIFVNRAGMRLFLTYTEYRE